MENEQATFNEMEENYEAAIDKARRIIKGKVEAEDKRDSQPERAIQLTSQRKSLQDQRWTSWPRSSPVKRESLDGLPRGSLSLSVQGRSWRQ